MSKRSGQEQGGIFKKPEKERKIGKGKKERSRNPPFTNMIRHNWTKCTAEDDITEPGDKNHISSSPCSDK